MQTTEKPRPVLWREQATQPATAGIYRPHIRPVQEVPLPQWQERVNRLYDRKSDSARYRMAQGLRDLVEWLGPDATTWDLTTENIELWSEILGETPRRASTLNGLLRSIRRGCRLAVKWRWLHDCPFRGGFEGWHAIEAEPLRSISHSRANLARVLAHLRARAFSWEGHRLYALASVFIYAGLRRTEALRLRSEDVDLSRRLIWVRSTLSRRLKTESSDAPVPMPAALVEILRDWLPCPGSEWVFPGAKKLGPWTGGAHGKRAGDQLVAHGEALGIEHLTPHSLRHSLSTHLATHWGLPPRAVQLILRHASETTQRLYIHRDVENLVPIVEQVRF
jgi:integrase